MKVFYDYKLFGAYYVFDIWIHFLTILIIFTTIVKKKIENNFW